MTQVVQRANTALTWQRLLHITALANIIVLTSMGIVLGDRLPLGLAVVSGLGLELMHFRGGRLGLIVLGVLFADTVAWTLSATVANVVQGEELIRLFIPASLAALSLAGLIAALAILVWRRNPESGGQAVRMVALGALAYFVAAMVAGFVAAGSRGQAPAPRQSDLTLRTENMAFSTMELAANRGSVTVFVDNHDVWWHTWTIDALHVDLKIPSSGKRQITFTAAPGTYTYYCAIPGHAALGMRGTLTVR